MNLGQKIVGLWNELACRYYQRFHPSDPLIYCDSCHLPIPGNDFQYNGIAHQLYDNTCWRGTEFEKQQEEMEYPTLSPVSRSRAQEIVELLYEYRQWRERVA